MGRILVTFGFNRTALIGPFFFENEQGAMLNEFLFTKIAEEDIGNICFNRTALRTTQAKLYSMFRALFLKMELSAAELISFVVKNWTGHVGYYMANRGSHSNEIIFRKDCTFK